MKPEAFKDVHFHEKQHWWYVGRRKILRQVLDKYVRDRTGSILEIGCAFGSNLELLSNYGKLSAIELNDQARKLACEKDICPVAVGSFPGNVYPGKRFDFICMLDVLEHIEDDLTSIKALREKLNPDGRTLITVPAYRFLWGSHDIAAQHYRRYTKTQLLQLVRHSGFKVLYCTYFNTFLFPPIAMIRMLQKITGKNSGTDIYMPIKTVNFVLTKIFSSESSLLPRTSLPLGVSVLLVAERK